MDKDIEKTLKELRYNVPYKNVIVDIPTEDIPHFLEVALHMSILTSYHHYMFTSLVSLLYSSIAYANDSTVERNSFASWKIVALRHVVKVCVVRTDWLLQFEWYTNSRIL